MQDDNDEMWFGVFLGTIFGVLLMCFLFGTIWHERRVNLQVQDQEVSFNLSDSDMELVEDLKIKLAKEALGIKE